jgi:hypothetical protein
MQQHADRRKISSLTNNGWLTALFITALALYFKGLNGHFVWDDRTYFLDNDILPRLKPWDLKEIILHPSNYWYEHLPVRDFLFVVQYSLFGERTTGYHLVSFLLYLCAGLAIHRFLQCLYDDQTLPSQSTVGGSGDNTVRALFVTAFFILHPTHVESVAYISGQKDLLFAIFSFSSLALFCKAVKDGTTGRGRKFLGAIGLYYLSFLSKNTAVATAVVFPVFWFLFLRKKNDSVVTAGLLCILINIPAILWLQHSLQVMSPYIHGANAPQWIPFMNRLIRADKILGAHVTLAVKPFPLNFGYPFDDSLQLNADFWVGLSLLTLFVVLIALRSNKIMTFGLFLIITYLLPSLQLFVSIDNAVIYDRYLFIPIVGFGILLERIFSAITPPGNRPGRMTLAAAALILGLLSAGTYAYVPKFHSDVDSTRSAYALFPNWPTSSFNYVSSLIEAGRPDDAMKIALTEKTFSTPLWVRDYFLGWIYLEQGEISAALNTLERSSRVCFYGGYFPYPDIALARALMATGDHERARLAVQRVIQSSLYNPVVYYQAKELLKKIDSVSRIPGQPHE